MGTKRKYEGQDMHSSTRVEQKFIKGLITLEFHFVPSSQIQKVLDANNYGLRKSYLELSDMVDYWDVDNPPWRVGNTAASTSRKNELGDRLMNSKVNAATRREMDVKVQALREERRGRLRNRIADLATKGSEQGSVPALKPTKTRPSANAVARAFPDRWFCVDCAGRNAEEVIGKAQCDIRCMSMQPCGAGFPQEERRKFLDSNLSRALDRYELREILASADIESLSHCPFCDFAAIYPPIESAEEFHCQHPECGIISCRICHKKSHKPRSCISIARAQGRPTSLQRIQEAKSKALIRMCNKCGTPFVKEGGCNKMTCSVQGVP